MKRQIRLLAQTNLLLLIVDLLRAPGNNRHPLQTLKKANLGMLIDATGLKRKTRLTDQLHKAVKSARRANRQEWSDQYRLLYGDSIGCPINETEFVRRNQISIVDDVCDYYLAFGWEAANLTGRRPDHLLVELEFAARLLVMSARAETRGQSQLVENALAEFTRHHLNVWLPAFCDQLILTTTYPPFVETARMLHLVWPALVKWHDWIVDPEGPSMVRPGDEPENQFECSAPDLVNLETNAIH